MKTPLTPARTILNCEFILPFVPLFLFSYLQRTLKEKKAYDFMLKNSDELTALASDEGKDINLIKQVAQWVGH